jgi:hypothetical protein
MYSFFKNCRLLPALSAGISNLNSNSTVNCPSENKITREDFIDYYKNNNMFEYFELRNKIYDNFKKNLDLNNFNKSKLLFDNSTLYGLHYKYNICHCDKWKIYEDIFDIAIKNDYEKFVWFYENFINKLEEHLKKESIDETKLIFYDAAWLSKNEINFNILKKFTNVLFRDLVCSYANSKDKNTNTYKILEYLIKSGNLDIDQISYAQNTVCNIGDVDMFKFLDSQIDINYGVEHGDFFRSACSNDHLEIAKLLYEKKVHELNKFGFDNTFYIVCRNSKDINVIKWVCSFYNGKHIKELKTLFNSDNYNKEIKEYLTSLGYLF